METTDLLQRAARVALGLFMIFSAWLKLDRWFVAREYFAYYPYPQAFRDLVPPTEVLCGVGTIASAALPAVALPTAGVLVPLLAGAVFSHAAFGWVWPAAGRPPEPWYVALPSALTLAVTVPWPCRSPAASWSSRGVTTRCHLGREPRPQCPPDADLRQGTVMTVLVAGATGRQGGAVARHLLKGGVQVRALTRRADSPRAKELAAAGAAVVVGDLSDRASLDRAVAGADGGFSVQNYWEKGVGFDGEVRQGRNLADAAKAAGVRHFVQSTMAAGGEDSGLPHFRSKAEVEGYARAIGLPVTAVGTVYFMDGVLDPKLGGGLTFPSLAGTLRPDVRLHLLAVDDLGGAVAAVLRDPARVVGGRVDVASDRLTVGEMKDAYRRGSGRRPRSYHIPAWLLRLLNPEFAAQLRWHNAVNWHFDLAGVRVVYPHLTGFERFVREHHVTNL